MDRIVVMKTKPRLFGISVKQPPEYDDWYFQFGVDVEWI